jgi:hypothetical protein
MDALTFLLRLIGTTARIGAVIALTALVLGLFVQAGIPPFAQLAGTTLYQTIIVAGIVGISIVVVEIFIALYRRINERMRRKLVFIEQPGGFWDYVEKDGVLQLQAVLHVTNINTYALTISRPHLCLPSLTSRPVWQQCFQLYVDDDLYEPGTVGPTLLPRTLYAVVVKHFHRVAKPRSRSVVFLFEFCDQWRRRHRTRLHLEPLPPHRAGVPPN